MALTGILLSLIATGSAFFLGKTVKETYEKEYQDKYNKFPTKTNIPLQKMIEQQMRAALSKKLDVINPDVTNIYDYICSLRLEYGLPPNDNFGNPIWTKQLSEIYALSEENQVVKYFGDGGEFWFKKEPIEMFIKSNIRNKYTVYERMLGVPYYKKYRELNPLEKSKDRCVNACCLKNEESLYYHNLWQELMLRAMRKRGYALSYDGVHGTPEEEAEKERIQNYENAVKYPWTVTPDYLKYAKRELERIKSKDRKASLNPKALSEATPPLKKKELIQVYQILTREERKLYRRSEENLKHAGIIYAAYISIAVAAIVFCLMFGLSMVVGLAIAVVCILLTAITAVINNNKTISCFQMLVIMQRSFYKGEETGYSVLLERINKRKK